MHAIVEFGASLQDFTDPCVEIYHAVDGCDSPEDSYNKNPKVYDRLAKRKPLKRPPLPW